MGPGLGVESYLVKLQNNKINTVKSMEYLHNILRAQIIVTNLHVLGKRKSNYLLCLQCLHVSVGGLLQVTTRHPALLR